MTITERINLQLFAHANPFVPGTTPGTPTTNPVNRTSDSGFDPTMKTFFDTTLLENSRAENRFGQFSVKQKISGNKAEFRKFNKFPKAMTPIQEGVIPPGQEFGMTTITVGVTQHGAYTAISDRLEAESLDDVVFGASEEMGASAGETKDVLTRNVLSQSTCLEFAPIVGADGKETATDAASDLTKAAILTDRMVNRAATWLKKNHAPKVDGKYIALIHPSVAEDLRNSDGWMEAHKYSAAGEIFNGEIGELHGVRFIESNACKVAKDGAAGVATYETYFMGKDAYGEIEPSNETMEMIIKGKEYGGPLNQFSTVGYKFVHGAAILYPERLLVVKSGSSYSDVDAEN